jgi:release factor glutamine methyltransferase
MKYKFMEIYEPAEDSFLFVELLKSYFNENKVSSYLDMGSGSGILAEIAKESGVNEILCADINPDSVKFVQEKGFEAVETDLFDSIEQKFDLITFNAPYLPRDEREPEKSQVATTGGEKGDEIPLAFIEQAKKHLNPEGKILVLISSLTPFDQIEKFNPRIVARKKLFFEELLILEIENS